MNAVERVLYLADGHLPREAPYLIQATFPGETWPSGGSIKFDNVFLSYRPGLPAVLKGM